MVEKTVSKHLTDLEKYFANNNPVLQKACRVFHELDQLEFELGLIDNGDSNVRKSSWWPMVSLIGGHSTAKSEFIERYLESSIHASHHKFTVHQYSPQSNNTTLPGTALDADYRLPFYQISATIEQTAKGEGSKLNSYLELKAITNERLKGKLFINTPVLNPNQVGPTQTVLTDYVLTISDLVLVFTDLFDATAELSQNTIDAIIAQQDSNKFIYVIDHSEISLDEDKVNEIIASWQRRLAEMGIYTGQFIVLSDSIDSMADIEQRLANIDNDRTYRVLRSLEKSIRDIDDIYLPEVQNYLTIWKERINMSTLIILGFIVTLLLFGELTMGIVQFLFDPIIGSAFLLILIAIILPVHLMMGKVHGRFIMKTLQQRQKELKIMGNLSGLFEKSLTFWRIILPIDEPVGSDKKMHTRINNLLEKTKDLVQTLNNQFSDYQTSWEQPFNSASDSTYSLDN